MCRARSPVTPGAVGRNASAGKTALERSIPGTFVVNTAEMLGRYSNDRFAPTPHRVITANDALRHAIPFFYGPSNDAIIRVVDTCTAPGNPARYEPVRYIDHRRRLNIANFAHRHPKPPDASLITQ